MGATPRLILARERGSSAIPIRASPSGAGLRNCHPVEQLGADADARKAEASVPKMGVVASDGGLKGSMEALGDWQNLSIWVSESVILEELGGDRGGYYPAKGH